MKIDVLTLFPNSFAPIKESILGRAQQNKKIEINIKNIRDFSKDKHLKCDDTPFGGGEGMVMTPQPLWDAIESVKKKNSHIIYLSPKGRVLTQKAVEELSKKKHLVLVCGHYEGIDQRVIDHFACDEISIGDYILTGGELPAMVLIDCVARLLDGVLGNENSYKNESFAHSLLEFPQYTKPAEFDGLKVPEVLLNGNHKEIEKWRESESLKLTKKRRPELLDKVFEIKKLDLSYLKDISKIIIKTFKECEEEFYEDKKAARDFILKNSVKNIAECFSRDLYFGAFFQNKMIGIIRFCESKQKIVSFFVVKEYQGLGVGKMLFNKLLDYCKKKKIENILVWSSNYAKNIYKKLGFKQMDELQTTKMGMQYYPMTYKIK